MEAARASWGGLTFSLLHDLRDDTRFHVLSCAVWQRSQQSTQQVAQSLRTLCEAVRTHLNDFELRIFTDVKLPPVPEPVDHVSLPARMCADGGVGGGELWSSTWLWLTSQPFVRIVGFTSSSDAHVLGPLVPFLPMFDTASILPIWCGAAPDADRKRIVFCMSSEFSDTTQQHLHIHLAKWYKDILNEPQSPALVAAVHHDSDSSAYLPASKLPPIGQGPIGINQRLPLHWLTSFCTDAERGDDARLVSRIAADLRDPRKVRCAEDFDTALVQAFFWTNVVKLAVIVSDELQSWMFVHCMPDAYALQKAVSMVSMALLASPQRVQQPSFVAPLMECAQLCDDVPLKVALQQASGLTTAACAPFVATLRLDERVRGWKSQYLLRVGANSRFPGTFEAFFSPSSTTLMEGLQRLAAAVVDGIAAGKLPHKYDELLYFLALARTQRRDDGGAITLQTFQVGAGAVREIPSVNKTFAAHLRTAAACSIAEGVNVSKPATALNTAPAIAGTKRTRSAIPEEESGSVDVLLRGKGWCKHTSRTYNREYWHHPSSNTSLWCDDTLPPGWGWKQSHPSAAKEYVNMLTEEKSMDKPSSGHNKRGRWSDEDASSASGML